MPILDFLGHQWQKIVFRKSKIQVTMFWSFFIENEDSAYQKTQIFKFAYYGTEYGGESYTSLLGAHSTINSNVIISREGRPMLDSGNSKYILKN